MTTSGGRAEFFCGLAAGMAFSLCRTGSWGILDLCAVTVAACGLVVVSYAAGHSQGTADTRQEWWDYEYYHTHTPTGSFEDDDFGRWETRPLVLNPPPEATGGIVH